MMTANVTCQQCESLRVVGATSEGSRDDKQHRKHLERFHGLVRNGYGLILVDAPTRFETYSHATEVTARGGKPKPPSTHYATMIKEELLALPVSDLAANDCVLFLWCCWPTIKDSFDLIARWGFTCKTCRFPG